MTIRVIREKGQASYSDKRSNAKLKLNCSVKGEENRRMGAKIP